MKLLDTPLRFVLVTIGGYAVMTGVMFLMVWLLTL